MRRCVDCGKPFADLAAGHARCRVCADKAYYQGEDRRRRRARLKGRRKGKQCLKIR